MINLLLLGCSMVGMYRVAELEERSGGLWALITLVYWLGLSQFVGGFFGAALGFVASYLTMFIVKCLKQ